MRSAYRSFLGPLQRTGTVPPTPLEHLPPRRQVPQDQLLTVTPAGPLKEISPADMVNQTHTGASTERTGHTRVAQTQVKTLLHTRRAALTSQTEARDGGTTRVTAGTAKMPRGITGRTRRQALHPTVHTERLPLRTRKVEVEKAGKTSQRNPLRIQRVEQATAPRRVTVETIGDTGPVTDISGTRI